MTASPPRSYVSQVLWFWIGLLIFAVIGFAAFFLSDIVSRGGPVHIAVAGLVIVVTAVPALLAMGRGRVALGSGLLAGYALATVASAGQCTLLAPPDNYGFLSGALIYLFALALVIVGAVVVAVVESIRRR